MFWKPQFFFKEPCVFKIENGLSVIGSSSIRVLFWRSWSWWCREQPFSVNVCTFFSFFVLVLVLVLQNYLWRRKKKFVFSFDFVVFAFGFQIEGERIQILTVWLAKLQRERLVLARKAYSGEIEVTIAFDKDFNHRRYPYRWWHGGHVTYRGCHGNV